MKRILILVIALGIARLGVASLGTAVCSGRIYSDDDADGRHARGEQYPGIVVQDRYTPACITVNIFMGFS